MHPSGYDVVFGTVHTVAFFALGVAICIPWHLAWEGITTTIEKNIKRSICVFLVGFFGIVFIAWNEDYFTALQALTIECFVCMLIGGLFGYAWFKNATNTTKPTENEKV